MHTENKRPEIHRRQGRSGTSEAGARDGEVLGESRVPGAVGMKAS